MCGLEKLQKIWVRPSFFGFVLVVDGERELAAKDVGDAARVEALRLERLVQGGDLGLNRLKSSWHVGTLRR